MTAIDPPPQGRDQRVTASELVRHFGVWQERAARAPVYIMHRGRPRLVLTSIDVMDALCAPHSDTNGRDGERLAALLAGSRDLVLWCRRDGSVTAANRPAQAIFGHAEFAIERIARTGGGFLAAALDRVIAVGIAETIEISPLPFPDRRWSCLVEPMPSGAALIVRDMTEETALGTARALGAAIEQATAASERAGSARIGLRGYVEAPSPALVAMTGIAAEAFASVKFVSLFEIGARVAIGEAIEAVIDDGTARVTVARLLVNRGDPVAVTVALAAIRRAAPVEALVALVLRNTNPS